MPLVAVSKKRAVTYHKFAIADELQSVVFLQPFYNSFKPDH